MQEAMTLPNRCVLDARRRRRGRERVRIALWILSTAVALCGASGRAAADWPERPITIVVMYAPGGGTDTVVRTLAAQMSRDQGWRINVVNRPGAAGALATDYVMHKPSDGYTLLGASNYNKYAPISGGSESKPWTDWYYMQAATGLASWSVRPDSPFKSFADVVAAAKRHPGEVTISTSGTGGQWHELAALIARAAGIRLKYVPYASGQLATLAGLSGEVDIAGGGVHEHIQFVDSGQLASLLQTGTSDITTPSGKVMPSIGRMLPAIREQLPLGGAYNLGVRRNTPIGIVRQLQGAFLQAVNSDAFKQVAKEHHLSIEVRTGADADRRAALLEVTTAELFEQLGIPGARSSKELGLPTPAQFDQWWPPRNYEPLPL
jgi:tripartite-type tricarboxylate transporter receptor subunit TctC